MSLMRSIQMGWSILSGANTGMPCSAATRATDANHEPSFGLSRWVKTATTSRPLSMAAFRLAAPISW